MYPSREDIRMPKLRTPPVWWYRGDAVTEVWAKGPHELTDGFWCKTTHVRLRPVPPDIAWEIVLAEYRGIKAGDRSQRETKVNCTTRATLAWPALVRHYNRMQWGRPAAGIAMQEKRDGKTRRHEVAWCVDPRRRLWLLDNLGDGPVKTSGRFLYSWALC